MQAELKGKTVYGQDRREDELTSSFFGPIRYSSHFGAILGKLLRTARFDTANDQAVFEQFLLQKETEKGFDISFWERKSAQRAKQSYDEIDLLVRFPQPKNIAIEVKFHSGESGEDQLPKYAENWRDELDYLFIWADHDMAQSIFRQRKEIVLEKAPQVKFGWISWENVVDELSTLAQNLDFPNRAIAQDLHKYLVFKGFSRFVSFDNLTQKLNEFAIVKPNHMSSSEPALAEKNIQNAVEVLRSTYQELKKLMSSLDEKAKAKDYEPLTLGDDFLHWFNYRNPDSWVLGHFVKVFREKTDQNRLFSVELNLEDFPYGRPSVVVGCHLYAEPPLLDRGVGGSWRFNHRYWNADHYDISEKEGVDFIWSTLKPAQIGNAAGKNGFQQAAFKKTPLFGLNRDNLDRMVFEVFQQLKENTSFCPI